MPAGLTIIPRGAAGLIFAQSLPVGRLSLSTVTHHAAHDLTGWALTLCATIFLLAAMHPARRKVPARRLPAAAFPRSVAHRARRVGATRSLRRSRHPGQPRAIFCPLLSNFP